MVLSPTDPCGSDGGTSSSSDEPALDDSSSLSANTHSLGLELKTQQRYLLMPSTKHISPQTRENAHVQAVFFYMKLKWASPYFLGLWNIVRLILSLFTQLTQVHLSLQRHLKAACVHQLQLQPQTLETEGGTSANTKC